MNCVYLLRCADGTLYCGWTSDIARRLTAHNLGAAGAKYTRARRPVTLVYCEACPGRSEAMRREAALKRLTHAQKEALAQETAGLPGERLTVYDSGMRPVGGLPRALVHRCGLRHRVVHVLAWETRDGVPGIWLQQRGFDRPVLPGFYDWTATGHVGHGETVAQAAARELEEEAGLAVPPDALVFSGEYRQQNNRGPDFFDDETASIFLLPVARPAFAPGPEVIQMVWAAQDALRRALTQGTALPVVLQRGATELVDRTQLCLSPGEWKHLSRRTGLYDNSYRDMV